MATRRSAWRWSRSPLLKNRSQLVRRPAPDRLLASSGVIEVRAADDGAVVGGVDVVEGSSEFARQLVGREDLEVDLGALLGAAADRADIADEVAGLDPFVDDDDLAGVEVGRHASGRPASACSQGIGVGVRAFRARQIEVREQRIERHRSVVDIDLVADENERCRRRPCGGAANGDDPPTRRRANRSTQRRADVDAGVPQATSARPGSSPVARSSALKNAARRAATRIGPGCAASR